MTQSIDQLLQHDVQLRSFNTMNVAAKARQYAVIRSEGQLRDLLEHTDVSPEHIFVLGGGSNILLAGDYDGLVLHMGIEGKKVLSQTEEHVWLQVGAGENWHETVRYAVDKGWGGIENLSLIPGRVGAAPIQNIGAYGAELKDVFEELRAVHIETGEIRTFTSEECRFGYRDSIFKNELKGKYIITGVVLKLHKDPEVNTSYGAIRDELQQRGIDRPGIRDVSDIVIDIRNSKLPDPADIGNAGSFFKNPVIDTAEYERLKHQFPEMPGYPLANGKTKVPAGWLIEKAGWKGRRVGNTGTYKQQALVIVNHGGATADDILQLARKIQRSVKKQFEIELVPEVNIIS